jgi:hypothetical protein
MNTSAEFDPADLILDWEAAARAVARLDDADPHAHADLVTDLMVPDTLPDGHAWPRACTLLLLGALSCAAQMARLNRHAPGHPDGAMYALEVHGPAPGDEDGRDRLLVVRLVALAANGQHDTAKDLIRAQLRPETTQPERIAYMLYELLRMDVYLRRHGPIDIG